MINKNELEDFDVLQFGWSNQHRGFSKELGRYDRLLDVIYNSDGRFPIDECTDVIKLVPVKESK